MSTIAVSRRRGLRLALGVLALLGVLAALRLAGVGHLLSMATLRAHRLQLAGWVQGHAGLAAASFVGVYALAAALCIPGEVVLTMAGGLLFGAAAGTALSVLGATTGAVAAFLAARALFGIDLLDRLGPRAGRLAAAMRRNAWSYLLVLRLVPLFPFVLVNLVPAVVGVRLPVYALTTVVGIIPASSAFSLAGAGLGAALDAGGAPDLRAVLTPQILGALLLLAALALLAIPLRARLAAAEGGR